MMESIKYWGSVLLEFTMDGARYWRWSTHRSRRLNRQQLRGRLLANLHVLEKGFSLPNPNDGFGASNWRRLEALLLAESCDDFHRQEIGVAVALAKYYLFWHDSRNVPLDPGLKLLVSDIANMTSADVAQAGVELIDICDRRQSYKLILRQRRSTRVFKSKVVDKATIQSILDDVILSPSVCNRQSWRLVQIEPDRIQQVLALQNGNRGFGETVGNLFAVLGEVGCFDGANERNQVYIDGGIFCMGLLTSISSHGLASCCLNLSLRNRDSRRLRDLGLIKSSELPIALVAFGYPTEPTRVAVSQRLTRTSIMRNFE